jgi:hypothetical protein
MDGLYPGPCKGQVSSLLSPSSGETKRILDLGNFFACLVGLSAQILFLQVPGPEHGKCTTIRRISGAKMRNQ